MKTLEYENVGMSLEALTPDYVDFDVSTGKPYEAIKKTNVIPDTTTGASASPGDGGITFDDISFAN